MDPFKRALLLSVQAGMGQITADEAHTEMKALIPQMLADPDSQLPQDKPASAEVTTDLPPRAY